MILTPGDQVWAVTVGGRVLYRQGVTSSCPEGVGWLSVPTHTNREVSQVRSRLLNLEHVELK